MSAFGKEIPQSQICIIKGGVSKHDALETLINAVATNPAVTSRTAFGAAVHEREAVMSTGIGGGIAIPHVRIPQITEATLGVAVVPKGLDFGALDNELVQIMVLFATPEGADKEYLGLLAKVMCALRDRDLFDRLVACRCPSDVYQVLQA
jgi:mannitol/fructose-specific phosphotransferase system IIA component (Ntr-type)